MQELRAGLHGWEKSLTILDQYFYHFVTELYIHDGGHCLLSGPDQSAAKHNSQVGGGHQVLVTLQRDFIEMTNENF